MITGVRRAKKKDKKMILELLHQVLDVHHEGRPDLFRPATTKYSDRELDMLIKNDSRPIFVAVDEKDHVLGYAFTVVQDYKDNPIMQPIKTLYIDDLCVDEKIRGQHVGRTLFDYVVGYARANGFYNVTLNVWECNENARAFYEHCGLTVQKTGMEKVL